MRYSVLGMAAAAMIAAPPTSAPAQISPAGLPLAFWVTSPAYKEFQFLDRRHASAERDCGGRNLSPPLAWGGEPKDTKSFAVTYYDPDGNNGQGEAHWIGYNIPVMMHALAEGAMSGTTPGMTVGIDDHGKQEYYGACPPFGKYHHYVYGVYALDIPVGELKPGMKREDLLKAVFRHVRAYQSIVFTYQRVPPSGWSPEQSAPPPGPPAATPPAAPNG